MKKLRKIGAIVLAVMMVAVVGLAYAATDTADTSTDTYHGASQTTVNTGTGVFTFTKSIVMFNTDGSTIREPNITYTYSAAKYDTSADDGALLTSPTVTDGTNTIRVLNGVANAVNIGNAVFTSNDSAAAPTTGIEIGKTVTATVNTSSFTRAGIYRYKITEAVSGTTGTDAEKLTAAGVTRESGYSTERYLDVYIGNKTGGGFELIGAVIFKTDSTDNQNPATTAVTAINTNTDKTTGYEPSATGTGTINYTNDVSVDRYFTYNLTVAKVTTGNLADKTHDFPFIITLSNSNVTSVVADYSKVNATYDTTSHGSEPTTVTITSSDSVTVYPKMSDGDSITLTGLPIGTTVTVKEYNDTVDTYKLTTAFSGTSSAANIGSSAAAIGTAEADATGETGIAINSGDSSDIVATTKTTVTFTNTIQTISPTGYVTRFAPYALILIGGIALLIISRKHRKHTDEE